jgi:hypothetical protein
MREFSNIVVRKPQEPPPPVAAKAPPSKSISIYRSTEGIPSHVTQPIPEGFWEVLHDEKLQACFS